MEYVESLPKNCPPSEAELIISSIEVFRLVKNNPPKIADFKSIKYLQPNRDVPNECLACGLSVWKTSSKCEKTKKLPAFKKHHTCKLTLSEGAGRILSSDSNHRTWWPFKTYNVLDCCELEAS